MYLGTIGLIVIACCIYGVTCEDADTLTGSFLDQQESCSAGLEGCTNTGTFIIQRVEEAISIANSADIQATDSSDNLKRIKSTLKAGKVRAGVVGLTKSGKSTFLNALLGKQYLPSSIQAQTAKEVSIIHTPKSPGELYVFRTKSPDTVEAKPIAVGVESINSELLALNREAKESNTTFQKVFLHAPVLFLEDTDSVKLEISDTPGLYEAAAGNTSVDSELAVKEMCAFVLMLNIQFLKTEKEARIIKSLIQNHPDLFNKLSRIMILVNAYDVAFMDDNKGNLEINDIAPYVAGYLEDPNIIGIKIPNPSEQIIPFSAEWALNARMWSADPAGFLQTENAKILYEQAVILIQRVKNYEAEFKPFEQAEPDDIQSISASLLEFSKIKTIEEQMKTMLYENGPSILLEAAVDDSIAEIAAMLGIIDDKIESMNIGKKETLFSCYEMLSFKFNELKSGSVHPPAVPSPDINSITGTLRGTFNSRFNSIFQNHLIGFHMHNDRNVVFNRICGMKPLLTEPANTELRASWNSLSAVIRHKCVEHAKSALSDIKTAFVAALSSFSNSNPICGTFAKELSGKLSLAIDHIDINTLAPGFPVPQIHLDGNTISNDRLNQIRTSYDTRYKKQEHRKRSRNIWGKKRRKVYYSSESFQSVVYSPDLNAVQSVIATDATDPWVQSFHSNIEKAVSSVFNQLVQSIVSAKANALSSAEAELAKAVQTSQQVLKDSQETVNRLTARKNTLVKLQNDLKESM